MTLQLIEWLLYKRKKDYGAESSGVRHGYVKMSVDFQSTKAKTRFHKFRAAARACCSLPFFRSRCSKVDAVILSTSPCLAQALRTRRMWAMYLVSTSQRQRALARAAALSGSRLEADGSGNSCATLLAAARRGQCTAISMPKKLMQSDIKWLRPLSALLSSRMKTSWEWLDRQHMIIYKAITNMTLWPLSVGLSTCVPTTKHDLKATVDWLSGSRKHCAWKHIE
jgi:hypothetical protein